MNNMVHIACKSVGMAMGIAVVVLSIMHQLDVDSAISMLGIGVAALGIASFTK